MHKKHCVEVVCHYYQILCIVEMNVDLKLKLLEMMLGNGPQDFAYKEKLVLDYIDEEQCTWEETEEMLERIHVGLTAIRSHFVEKFKSLADAMRVEFEEMEQTDAPLEQYISFKIRFDLVTDAVEEKMTFLNKMVEFEEKIVEAIKEKFA